MLTVRQKRRGGHASGVVAAGTDAGEATALQLWSAAVWLHAALEVYGHASVTPSDCNLVDSSFRPRTNRDCAAAIDTPVYTAISARSCPNTSCISKTVDFERSIRAKWEWTRSISLR